MEIKGIAVSAGGMLVVFWGLVKFFQAWVLYQGGSEAWLGVSLIGLLALMVGVFLLLKR
ncbi:MAG: hypothetical protein HPY61_14625 [Methanotrichaceae archaeon]|nr:hypothetical protein [Methanotrichaceae archaeon]